MQLPASFDVLFCACARSMPDTVDHLKRHALLEPIKYRASQHTTAIPTGQQSQQAACRGCGRTRIFLYPSFHKEFTPYQLMLLGICLWLQVTTPVDQGRFERCRWTFTRYYSRRVPRKPFSWPPSSTTGQTLVLQRSSFSAVSCSLTSWGPSSRVAVAASSSSSKPDNNPIQASTQSPAADTVSICRFLVFF
ncbi:hypothetical protein BJX65DRAFT_151800 [Aspergillus insuetus]